LDDQHSILFEELLRSIKHGLRKYVPSVSGLITVSEQALVFDWPALYE